MAIHRIPILGWSCKPDNSGSVYSEPAAVNMQTNDRYPQMVWVFADTATKISLGGSFMVPKNYVGTAAIVLVWTKVGTSTNNALWDFDYTAVASGESSDPSADQEAATSGLVAGSGTSLVEQVTTINLTSANLVVDDLVQFSISRDGVGETTGLATSLYLLGAFFQYADA